MKHLAKKIPYHDPMALFEQFSLHSGALFFDSAMSSATLGRYSFIALDPFLTMSFKNSEKNPFIVLQEKMKTYVLETHHGLPPFQGGVAGYFGYDLYQYAENVPLHSWDDQGCPDMAVGFYDVVIAYDHVLSQAWIFSSGFPEFCPLKRERRARERLAFYEGKVREHCSSSSGLNVSSSPSCDLIARRSTVQADCSEAHYLARVARVMDYIVAGDIFEANISQRFSTMLPEGVEPYRLYGRLREISPATFSAYLNIGGVVIASASPERFLQLTQGWVETRPIKGTSARSDDILEDQRLANALINSEKDRAENIMIVDLMRNDLSRVCQIHSVKVEALCALESYQTVHHLVSVIRARLKEGLDAIDLLKATFPGGSITGAPKIRAMEIIAELEPNQRGPYCGSIAYLGFNGDMDSSIIIRTLVIKDQKITFQVGGAVVVDSDPAQEYQETLDKAKSLFDVLGAV